MAVFVKHQGRTKYLTDSNITELLQLLVRSTYPDMTPKEISCFSSHSGRFWAVVLLDEAGVNHQTSYSHNFVTREYLFAYIYDTSVIRHQHNDTLRTNSELITKPLGNNNSILTDIGPIDDDMGIYDDLDTLDSNL
jgi:hypothetical protein